MTRIQKDFDSNGINSVIINYSNTHDFDAKTERNKK